MEWLTNNIGIICSVLSAIVGIAGTVFGLIKGRSRTGKVLKGLATVIKQFPEFIRTAEKVGVNGDEKLTYVLNQAVLSCKALGFTPNEDQLIDMTVQIEEMVRLSKDINLHSKNTATPISIKPIQTLGGKTNEN